MLIPKKLSRLSGSEPLQLGSTGATVEEFWRWAYSDLRANTTRAVLAEFLVARALGDRGAMRDPWALADVVTPNHTTVEVKASGYLQSWNQLGPSKIVFGGLKARRELELDPDRDPDAPRHRNEMYSEEPEFRSDVYVFAVHTTQDPNLYDCLDLDAWIFYVLPRSLLAEHDAKTVTLAFVEEQGGVPLTLEELPDAVEAAAHAPSAPPGSYANIRS
jgi:hypothetical protein